MKSLNWESVYPDPQKGLDCLFGLISIVMQLFMCGLYWRRKQNRMLFYRFVGIIPPQTDVVQDRLENPNFQPAVLWENVVLLTHAHLMSLVALYLFFYQAKWQTVVWSTAIYYAGVYAVNGGAHMLWSHRSYKANRTYEWVMMLLHSMAMSNSIIHWSRDHRVHHKFVDTDADHTNRQRGLFFAHWGWLCLEKHPEVIRKGRKLDLSDLTENPVLAFQRKYLGVLYGVFSWLVPIGVPFVLWEERFWICVHVCVTLTWCLNVNTIAMVNSWFHSQGTRPYSKRTSATDGTFLRHMIALGAGDHNYHHAFPNDYAESEYDSPLLFTKKIIDFFALFGWVWGRKKMNAEMVAQQKARMDSIDFSY